MSRSQSYHSRMSQSMANTSNNGSTSPEMKVCYCGQIAPLITATTSRNARRRFFRCDNYSPRRRGYEYFEWFDNAVNDRFAEALHGLMRNRNHLLRELENKKRIKRWLMALLLFSWIVFGLMLYNLA